MNIQFLLTATLFSTLAGCGGASATGDDIVKISQIQGSGPSSPMLEKDVSIVAIVSGDFQSGDDDGRDLDGFYVQQEQPDTNPLTSEGVFIFDGPTPSLDVEVGDRVHIDGVVQEYFGETQIASRTVRVIGTGDVRVTHVELPAKDVVRNEDGELIADLERFEGMLLRFDQQFTVGNLRHLERFGEVGLTAGGRVMQFTNGNKANVQEYEQHRSSVAKRSIVIDDGRRDNNPEVIRYLNAAEGNTLRVGDSLSTLTGNLRFSRGSGGSGDQTWRIMPMTTTEFTNDNPRPDVPPTLGNMRVASVNVLNYFNTIDSRSAKCGPAAIDGCRGADSQRELERQTEKIVTALVALNADIIGLMELENNDGSLAKLVAALNTRLSDEVYDYVKTDAIHDGPIKTGFVFKPSSVALLGDFSLLDSTADPRFNDARNRPALAQSFRSKQHGAVVTVVVNHFKSKGSSCEVDGDVNANDGQGNCNGIRTAAATALADWINSDPTNSGDPDYLLIGDFNAYTKEGPLLAFKKAGLSNLMERIPAPYSINFNGQSGALDHAIATSSLESQVVSTAVWHINADEAPLHDYNLEFGRSADLFNGQLPFRASDHDPIIVDLALSN